MTDDRHEAVVRRTALIRERRARSLEWAAKDLAELLVEISLALEDLAARVERLERKKRPTRKSESAGKG